MALTFFSPEDGAFREELEAMLGADRAATHGVGDAPEGSSSREGEGSEQGSDDEDEQLRTSGRGDGGESTVRGRKSSAVKPFTRLSSMQVSGGGWFCV